MRAEAVAFQIFGLGISGDSKVHAAHFFCALYRQQWACRNYTHGAEDVRRRHEGPRKTGLQIGKHGVKSLPPARHENPSPAELLEFLPRLWPRKFGILNS